MMCACQVMRSRGRPSWGGLCAYALNVTHKMALAAVTGAFFHPADSKWPQVGLRIVTLPQDGELPHTTA